MLSPQDILMVLAVGFVLFGSKKLPEVARSLGQGVQEFKKAVDGAPSETPVQAAPPPAVATTADAPPASATTTAPPAESPNRGQAG